MTGTDRLSLAARFELGMRRKPVGRWLSKHWHHFQKRSQAKCII